ncbi:uncharacterized protein LOC133039673 [Cannabis sativa]|uniref:uncharacterized protein LOC133039673 n=1 Tax=Cannabis sativa TaxID=3483 RepID=UPI0029C9C91F|nr:uncharacterized protein LOC133039673 [Cannabis sativa]
MDKSWIWSNNKLSEEYTNGVSTFINLARSHLNDENKTPCPCTDCVNFYYHELETVERHLWVNDNEDSEEEDDEMFDVIEDITGGVNFETNQNDEIGGEETYYNEPTNFKELFDEVEKELYPGCSQFSSLTFLVKMMHIKVLNKMSDKCFDMILELLCQAFPTDHKLPKSHYEAKRMLRTLGLGYETIHVCKNDCTLFWKEYKDATECPTCGFSSYKHKGKKKKNVPVKKMHYFPITPRLQRLFMSRHTSDEMRWHKEKRVNTEGVLRHPADGEAWKEFDKQFPEFAKDPRNVRLGLATDGFNPFGNMSTSYSIWPVVLVPYNMPPWKCMKENNFIMALLTPGPNSPGKEIDVYLRPLIDELKQLWEEGVTTYDVSNKKEFIMRAAILWTINDFPAYGTISGWSTKGYNACPVCNVDALSFPILSKISYMGHRRFLPLDHPWRKDKRYDGKIESRPPPKILSEEDILKQLETVDQFIPGKIPKDDNGKLLEEVVQRRKRLKVDVNGGKTQKNKPIWSRKCIFWELEYWSKLNLRHNLDVMHIEKNICESIYGTMLCIDKKSKDTEKARLDLQRMNLRKELHLKKQGDKWFKPQACYTLPLVDRRKFCTWLGSVKFPDGYAANISRNVNISEGKIIGLKSHDCHVLLQRLLPVGLRPYVKKDVILAISELSLFFRKLCAKTLYVEDLDSLEKGIVKCLCKLESIFPPAFFDVMIHLAVHLPSEAKLGGPVHTRWMYPIERFLGSLKNLVKNRARSEGSIAVGYVGKEALTFCSMYLHGIETKFNRPERNWDLSEVQNESTLSVFDQPTRLFGGREFRNLEPNEYNKLHCEHKALLQSKGVVDIIRTQELEFSFWFKEKINEKYKLSPHQITKSVLALASMPDHRIFSYNGCIVNGVRYHTEIWGVGRTTQNYGVWVEGEHGGSTCDFYGVITDILEVSYIYDHKVVLFQCDWYDTDTKKKRTHQEYHITSINVSSKWYKEEPYILADQANQVLYLEDDKFGSKWRVVDKVNQRHLWDVPEVILESVDAEEDGSNSYTEAYQEERSNDIDITFDESNVEIPLNHPNAELIEINSSYINFEIINCDQILNESNVRESDDDISDSKTDIGDIDKKLQHSECSSTDESDDSL